MFYIIMILAVIITAIILRFVYKKTKSLHFINSFELVDGVLYKDKLPYSESVRVNEIGEIRAYFDFHKGELNGASLYMNDGARVYWRRGDKYVTCYDREGNSLSQARFESLYSRFVDIDSILAIFNRNFKKCQLAI